MFRAGIARAFEDGGSACTLWRVRRSTIRAGPSPGPAAGRAQAGGDPGAGATSRDTALATAARLAPRLTPPASAGELGVHRAPGRRYRLDQAEQFDRAELAGDAALGLFAASARCRAWLASITARSPAPYEQTAGRMNTFRRQTAGTWPGDPARAARILLGIVSHPDPPLRLLLGAGAVDSAEKSAAERGAEAAAWADVSRSADFPAVAAADAG